MKYKNGVKYEDTFAGIKVSFVLTNFSQDVVDRFNAALAEKALEQMKKEERKID